MTTRRTAGSCRERKGGFDIVRRRFGWWLILLVSILVFGSHVGQLTTVFRQGSVSTWWPKSLESLKERVKFCDTGPGLNQSVYEIPFDNREEFERVWPILLTLKTPGAPLTLYRPGHVPKEKRSFEDMFSFDVPAVFIFAPSPLGVSDSLRAGPPWPDSIVSPKGELPEYVESKEVAGQLTWVPVVPEDMKSDHGGVRARARIDFALVVDGNVINLNRTVLPSETPIVDLRFVDAD